VKCLACRGSAESVRWGRKEGDEKDMDAQEYRNSHQLAHTLEKEWHHCLVQVGAHRESVDVSLHLDGLWHLHGLLRLHLKKQNKKWQGFWGGQCLEIFSGEKMARRGKKS
jgi:hypothetical protein